MIEIFDDIYDDIYEDFYEDKKLLDFSEYPRDSNFCDLVNKKVIAKVKVNSKER